MTPGCSRRRALIAFVIITAPGCGRSVAVPAPSAPASLPPVAANWATAVDLYTNRVHVLAHASGTLLAPAGGPEFLKFVDGGWKTSWILGEKDAGQRVAFVNGLSGILFVPVDADGDGVGADRVGDLRLGLRVRSLARGQKVSIFFNEKSAGTIEVPSEWSTISATVPAALVKVGDNRVRLQFRGAAALPGGKRSAAALESFSLGPVAGSAPPQPADVPVTPTFASGADGRIVATHGPARLSYYVPVPARARLAVSYSAATPGVAVSIRAARDGGAQRVLFTGPAEASATEGAWDLAEFAGHAVRIDLVCRGGGVVWRDPRVEVLMDGPPQLRPPVKKFDHIFVWMVDTLRADKVHVYNPKTVVSTPNYDAFAADSTRFAWAHVPGTWSLPSHGSIMTGVYPSVHKAVAHEARLARDIPLLPEALAKAGYRTALFSSNGYVSDKWGFDRGWSHNTNFIRQSLPNGADHLWKTAKSWMDASAQRDKPWFLYLATIEPHVIYNPKKQFLQKYWKTAYQGPIKPGLTGIQLGSIKSGKLKVNDTDKAYLEALHNAEITQSDSEFARFIADLKQRGLYDTSVVVVVSDHGDEFWEHGGVGHAHSAHQELVHVPLMIRAPGLLQPGKVIETDVEAMDLEPTLLELAGLLPGPQVQGESLLALAQDDRAAAVPRVALSQNGALTRGAKAGTYRLINSGLGHLELYDEKRDPTEQNNLAETHPIALRQMRNVMGVLVGMESRWSKHAWGTAASVREGFYAASAALAR